MTSLILCNIGVQDVQIKVDEKTEKISPPREKGREILEQYDVYSSKIILPIIEPALLYILNQIEKTTNRVVFFATDQPDKNYQEKDTLYFARIASRKVAEIFGETFGMPEVQLVQGINPAYYDEAFEVYDRLIASLRDSEKNICYIIPAGGIPACNMALLFQGVRYFGDKLQAVYPTEGRDPQPLRIGRQILDSFRRAAAIERIQRLDFANALPYLEGLGVDPGLFYLCSYAASRFDFDFSSAESQLDKALRDGSPASRNLIQSELRHALDNLLRENDPIKRLEALLEELYWNAVITYRHCRYADFLGRVYRFQEAILRYLVESVYHLPTDRSIDLKEQNQAIWEQGIATNSGLSTYLSLRSEQGKPLDWHSPSRPVYKAMLSYAMGDSGKDSTGQPLISTTKRDSFKALLSKVNALDRLVELRHHTIIGHDFQGVSEAILREVSPGNNLDPLLTLHEILAMQHFDIKSNVYQTIAEFLIAHL